MDVVIVEMRSGEVVEVFPISASFEHLITGDPLRDQMRLCDFLQMKVSLHPTAETS